MFARICFGVAFAAAVLFGHDMVHEGAAGPYRLTVYLNPHAKQPNVVEILARAEAPIVEDVRFALTSIDASSNSTPFAHVVVGPRPEDPSLFQASLPLPPQAFWRVHVEARGAAGEGAFSIPVAAAAPAVGLTPEIVRVVAGLLWFTAAVAVWLLWSLFSSGSGALSRFAFAAALTCPLFLGAVYRDWVASAVYHPAVYQRLYQPLELRFGTSPEGLLRVELHDPGRVKFRRLDDLVLDHGHPMHLYAVALPELDRVYHLHPEMTGVGVFEKKLPAAPAGRYFVVTDIVHESGLWEAPRGEWSLDQAVAGRFEGDDSGAAGPPVSAARYDAEAFELPDGYRIVWRRPDRPLRANDPLRLDFALQDPKGEPARDVELYMGMLGHAAIVRHDLEVFSHVHPTGSIAMASLNAFSDKAAPVHDHAGHSMPALPSEVTFPYAFPEPGRYRIVVQIKRGGQVETGFFDAEVAGGPDSL